MNQVLLFITVLVIFVYFGGSNVPKVLRDNKQMLLGVFGGLVLFSFMGIRLEGFGLEGCEREVEAKEGLCDDLEERMRIIIEDPAYADVWAAQTPEDYHSVLNRFCNNMGPFAGSGITENRVLTPEDDDALKDFHLQNGKFRLSETDYSEVSGCSFCERPEVSGATYPCFNLYDRQLASVPADAEAAPSCAEMVELGVPCSCFTEDKGCPSLSGANGFGFCNETCGVCQGH